jgi:hypothetical protein
MSVGIYPNLEALMRRLIPNTLIVIAAALALVAVPVATAATDVHRANLNGSNRFPAVTGKAKFSRDDGVRQLEAEIQHANALAGTRVRFRVNGHGVGTATVNGLGTARIDRSGSAVPAVSAGSTIRVRRLNEALVASGRFN